MDLSAKKKKRLEGRTQPNFDFEGKNFLLPWEVPLSVSTIGGRIMRAKGTEEYKNKVLAEGLRHIGQILLRDQYDMFVELGGSGPDLMELLDSMDEIYTESAQSGVVEEPEAKMESGESSASE